MAISIQQIHPVFVGEVSGVDLTKPLSPDEAREIESGMDRFAVLVFHDQPVSDDQQQAFSRNFGELENAHGGNITKAEDRRLQTGMNDVSNLDKDNKPLAPDSRQRMFNLGNRLWHSDSSFRPVPAKYSLLSGRAIPAGGGGNTEFADMRAAYDSLDAPTKAEIEDLVCEHSLMYSRGSLGFDVTDEEKAMFKPVRQRLVRTHPASGRKSIYLSSHAGTILGWPVPVARMLLKDLTEHATQSAYVYSHQWRQHDLVMWDNRCTMHRVRSFDETEVRDMRRTTVAGSEVTVEQAA